MTGEQIREAMIDIIQALLEVTIQIFPDCKMMSVSVTRLTLTP